MGVGFPGHAVGRAGASIELFGPNGVGRTDPEAANIAYLLNQHPAIGLDNDFARLSFGEWQRAMANPYVTPHAKAALGRLAGYFQNRLAPIPGLPKERAQVRQELANAGMPVFNRAYPTDLTIPAAVKAMNLVFPFNPGVQLLCQQGNNTMHDPASHAPDGLRYALDFTEPGEKEGLPILSCAPGTAYVYKNARVNHPDNWGFGNFVLVDHGNGYATMYAHLKDTSVKNGQRVGAGDTVGTLGTTGSAGNAHLHFQVCTMDRIPDPAREEYHAEFGSLPPNVAQPPFGNTVPFELASRDMTTGEMSKRHSSAFVGGEAGALPRRQHLYSA